MAAQVLNEMKMAIGWRDIKLGLSQITRLTGMKGRWQRLSNSPLTICDSGHNVDAFKLILKEIDKTDYDSLYMILGAVKDKDPDPVLSLLPPKATYYFCEAHVPRAMDADHLAMDASKYGLSGIVIRDVNQAILEARKRARPSDLVFIGGSTFVVAEIQDL